MHVSQPALPTPRGPISAAVITALQGPPTAPVLLPRSDEVDLLTDDDAQLALACSYELHYRGFAGVDDAWEWSPELVAATSALEGAFVDRLADEVGGPAPADARSVLAELRALADADGPSLSRFMLERGTWSEMREFVVHRSQYQRKEADGHTFAMPRIRGRAKAAMVTIQHDEYGEGSAPAMHAELFATTMQAFGLDPSPGAYLDLLPGVALATDNLVTLFGLHRCWRGAAVGHLALFEMTSVGPMQRYSDTLRRLGVGADARRFYDVHVEADAWHERVAEDEMVAGFLESEPAAAGTVGFGARALTFVEGAFASRLLERWAEGRTSLLAPLADVERPLPHAVGGG
jgi:hypothetical protein